MTIQQEIQADAPISAPRPFGGAGFARLHTAEWLDLVALQTSFNSVPLDPYVPEGFRRKSISRIRMNGSLPVVGPHEPLFQDEAINPTHGGLHRDYPAIPVAMVHELADAVRLFQTVTRIPESEEVLVQAQRVTPAADGSAGLPAVEGWHQDGVSFVGILLVDRAGLAGGKTLVSATADGSDLIFAGELQPGELLVFEDPRVWHWTSPVRSTGKGLPHRDVVLFGWPSARQKKGGA
jgi:hypothetical protein